MTRKKRASPEDSRRSIKISDSLWTAISIEIEKHPEWGVSSVSEFIRRAVDHELSARRTLVDRKTIELILDNLAGQADSRDRGR